MEGSAGVGGEAEAAEGIVKRVSDSVRRREVVGAVEVEVEGEGEKTRKRPVSTTIAKATLVRARKVWPCLRRGALGSRSLVWGSEMDA